MFESILQEGYWYMFMQVVVTLLVFPMYSAHRLTNNANAYCERFYPDAMDEMQRARKRSFTLYAIIVFGCFCIALGIVLQAKINAIELFNWDNQAGLSVLFIIAMVPVACMVFIQKSMFSIFKKYVGSKRTASLKLPKWQSYFSLPLVLILLVGQVLFVATIVYFINHPFDGFAGYVNLIGLVLIDLVFSASCYAIYNSKKMAAIKAPEQRVAIKTKAIKINMIIWIVSIYHLSASIWIAGLELEGLSLVTQSLYLQLVIFLMAYTIMLPKPKVVKVQ